MSEPGLEQRFAAAFPFVILEATDEKVLVACSGGGDSIALLHLAVGLLGAERVCVATVNHNLRDVQAELDLVARHCSDLGVRHQVLDWRWNGQGNLQAAARNARQELLQEHASLVDAYWIVLGHTKDDQAETFLMRLARGSGVDGLAAMEPYHDLMARPLLGHSRQELREWLRARGLDWAEDPSNDDLRFDRVKARAMMSELEKLGLTKDRLVATAKRMSAEREALVHSARQFAKAHGDVECGAIILQAAEFSELPESMQTRVLAGVIRWFSGSPYKPRADELDQWLSRIWSRKPAPLSGVLGHARKHTILFYREPAAAAPRMVLSDGQGVARWDKRWVIHCPEGSGGLAIGPLGQKTLRDIPNWRDHALPRQALETSPAIWRGDTCIASLVIDPPESWSVSTKNWTLG